MFRKSDLIDHLQELAASEKAADPKETAMPDEPSKTGQDRKFIALEQEYEVRSWCESLGCSREQLRRPSRLLATQRTRCVNTFVARERWS